MINWKNLDTLSSFGKLKDLKKRVDLTEAMAGEGGAARAFAEEMERSGVASRIRAEAGNERYEYFFPMNDPETVLLIDRWADQAAIDAHHVSPMMQTIAALREKYDLHMRVERFVPDGVGAPAGDAGFIRS